VGINGQREVYVLPTSKQSLVLSFDPDCYGMIESVATMRHNAMNISFNISARRYFSQLPFIAVAFVAIVLCPSSTKAEVFVEATLSRFPFGNFPADFVGDTALNSPPSNTWISIVLSAFTTQSTFARIDANIFGTMHQRWNRVVPNFPGAPTPSSGVTNDGDSHMVTPPYSSFFSSEDNNDLNLAPYAVAAPDTDQSNYGIGTFLRGFWLIPETHRASEVDLAYLVIPRDSLFSANTVIELDIELSNGQRETKDVYVCAGGEGAIGACSYDPPEISVSGNNRVINDNDTTPLLLDSTDFGIAELGSSQVRTFNIRNLGVAPLELGSPVITGPFSIVGEFPTSIRGNLNQLFKVALDTSVRGKFQGSISFSTNDSNESPFNFALSAEVVPEPASLTLVSLSLLILTTYRNGERKCGRKVLRCRDTT
jgi:hypothetical protein